MNGRSLAGGPLDRLDRGADVLPLLIFRHANVDDLAARETVRDELGVTLLALLDQERIVVGDGLIESQGWLDAVLVQRREYAEDPDTVAILVVAVAADVGKAVVRRVSGPQPSGPPWGSPAAAFQSQCSRLTMTAKATRALSGHLGSASGDADHNPQRIALPRRRGLGSDIGEPGGPHICSNQTLLVRPRHRLPDCDRLGRKAPVGERHHKRRAGSQHAADLTEHVDRSLQVLHRDAQAGAVEYVVAERECRARC